MQFAYVVKNVDGSRQEGILEAPDPHAAARTLQQQGHFVLSVTPLATSKERFQWRFLIVALHPVAPRVLAAFYRMIESCLHAGMTVLEAVSRSTHDLPDARLRGALRDVADRLSGGQRFVVGLDTHPEFFPPHVRELVRVGEENGCLEAMVGELARAYERDDRITRSLRWPTGVLLCSVLPLPVLWRFFNWVRYLALYTVTPERVPADPRAPAIAATSMWFRQDGPYCLVVTLVLVLLVLAVRVVLRYPGSLPWRDALSLRLPHWGPLIQSCVRARFLRTLFAAHHAGQSFAEALTMATAATGNSVWQSRLAPQIEPVRGGMKLTAALRAANVLPREIIGDLAAAEDTGRLEEALKRAVVYVEQDQEDALRAALTRSWVTALFWALAVPAFALIHVLAQWYNFAFDFADHLFD